MKWANLTPDPAMIAALDHADGGGSRSAALAGSHNDKRNWSNRLADGSARMIAAALRRQRSLSGLTVLPKADGAAEPRTFVAGGKTKQIDVIAVHGVSGLQLGLSLKGMNFRDGNGQNFDKNLTGRTYELQDELRVVHLSQPLAVMGAVYFLPLAAVSDRKTENSPSSLGAAPLARRPLMRPS